MLASYDDFAIIIVTHPQEGNGYTNLLANPSADGAISQVWTEEFHAELVALAKLDVSPLVFESMQRTTGPLLEREWNKTKSRSKTGNKNLNGFTSIASNKVTTI